MDQRVLTAILERVRTGQGADKEIDNDLGLALGYTQLDRNEPPIRILGYVESCDAALRFFAVRLPEWRLERLSQHNERHWFAAAEHKTKMEHNLKTGVSIETTSAARAILGVTLKAILARP